MLVVITTARIAVVVVCDCGVIVVGFGDGAHPILLTLGREETMDFEPVRPPPVSRTRL
jgi:hypothetical protein